MGKIEKLLLSEQYSFVVNVQYKNDTYAGELSLSPDSIRLEIMGEDNNKDTVIMRDFFSLKGIAAIHAYNHDDSFLLYGVHPIRWSSKTLNRIKKKGFFKIILEIDYVVFSKYHLDMHQEFRSLSIRSSSIEQLIGHTQIQGKLLEDGSSGTEFIIDVADGVLGYGYDYQMSYNSTKRLEEICPHLFAYAYGSFIDFLPIINNVFVIFSFLKGSELEIEEVKLFREGTYSSLKSSFYYPSKRFIQSKANVGNFFPWHINKANYGQFIGFNQLHLANYFSLNSKEQNYFSKYLRYKRMDSVEERFLGYFRVLESCSRENKSYVEVDLLDEFIIKIKDVIKSDFSSESKSLISLSERLKGVNRQKYNTATCIQNLMSSIDSIESLNWIYSKSDVQRICQLRNDITHANDYALDEIESITKFIEVLLVFSLLKLLGVNENDRVNLLPRLNGYKAIVNYAV